MYDNAICLYHNRVFSYLTDYSLKNWRAYQKNEPNCTYVCFCWLHLIAILFWFRFMFSYPPGVSEGVGFLL